MDYLDASPGEIYLLPKVDSDACFELKGKKRDGTYVLRHERTGRQQTFGPVEFRAMRFDGRAIRIGKAALAAVRGELFTDVTYVTPSVSRRGARRSLAHFSLRRSPESR